MKPIRGISFLRLLIPPATMTLLRLSMKLDIKRQDPTKDLCFSVLDLLSRRGQLQLVMEVQVVPLKPVKTNPVLAPRRARLSSTKVPEPPTASSQGWSSQPPPVIQQPNVNKPRSMDQRGVKRQNPAPPRRPQTCITPYYPKMQQSQSSTASTQTVDLYVRLLLELKQTIYPFDSSCTDTANASGLYKDRHLPTNTAVSGAATPKTSPRSQFGWTNMKGPIEVTQWNGARKSAFKTPSPGMGTAQVFLKTVEKLEATVTASSATDLHMSWYPGPT